MKHFLPLLLTLSACMPTDDMFTGIYFVKLEAEPAQVASIVTEIVGSLSQDAEILHIYDAASEGFSIRIPHVLIGEVEMSSYVKAVYEDTGREYITPINPDSIYEYGNGEVPTGIIRIGGPYVENIDLSSIHVAVLDTGIDSFHPDLNVVAEKDIVGETSGNYAKGTDPNGHGTHVAGTIGALADGEGVAGVAPGISLHAVRVLSSNGSGYYSDIIAGLEYVLENPEIRVVNLSLGGPKSNQTEPMKEALQRLEDAGIIVCIAAGNEAQNTNNVAPAAYNYGIVVSAYDVSANGNTLSDRGFAWFSNYGTAVDIAAPGVSINSTWPGGTYTPLDGTSMAAPHVTGAVAAFLANTNQEWTVDEIRDLIIETGENGYRGQDDQHPEPLLDFQTLMEQID
jgi:subtilisin